MNGELCAWVQGGAETEGPSRRLTGADRTRVCISDARALYATNPTCWQHAEPQYVGRESETRRENSLGIPGDESCEYRYPRFRQHSQRRTRQAGVKRSQRNRRTSFWAKAATGPAHGDRADRCSCLETCRAAFCSRKLHCSAQLATVCVHLHQLQMDRQLQNVSMGRRHA